MEKTNKQKKTRSKISTGYCVCLLENMFENWPTSSWLKFMQKCDGFRLVKKVLEKDKVGFTWFQNCHKATTIQRDCHYHKDR